MFIFKNTLYFHKEAEMVSMAEVTLPKYKTPNVCVLKYGKNKLKGLFIDEKELDVS